VSFLFHAFFPVAMILAPAAFFGLWCGWTGVRAMRPVLVATLLALLAYAAYAVAVPPALLETSPIFFGWALVPFPALCFGACVPAMRRAFAALPPAPRGARLATRRVELPRGARAAPLALWVGIAAAAAARGAPPIAWIGPALALLGLLLLPFVLRAAVLEGEPVGGPEPARLERLYEEFRRKRVLATYALFAVLHLALAATAFLPRDASGGVAGAVLGSTLGVAGALFGTWADAQRYLLRRRLAGAPPPGADLVQSAV
jgi:hypothetical protein